MKNKANIILIISILLIIYSSYLIHLFSVISSEQLLHYWAGYPKLSSWKPAAYFFLNFYSWKIVSLYIFLTLILHLLFLYRYLRFATRKLLIAQVGILTLNVLFFSIIFFINIVSSALVIPNTNRLRESVSKLQLVDVGRYENLDFKEFGIDINANSDKKVMLAAYDKHVVGLMLYTVENTAVKIHSITIPSYEYMEKISHMYEKNSNINMRNIFESSRAYLLSQAIATSFEKGFSGNIILSPYFFPKNRGCTEACVFLFSALLNEKEFERLQLQNTEVLVSGKRSKTIAKLFGVLK